jgi:eukaryotic-like serine/threonine-protein kinase
VPGDVPIVIPLTHGTGLHPGSALGRYRLVEPIGTGGMGQVWKAHDANLDRVVAIKLLHSDLGDETSRERFRREALILSRLSHPGVATIFDFDSKEGCDFLVMEYVPGGTLESRIRNGPLPIDEIVRLGASIADALDSAHTGGFLHRDLKPGNIVISEHGHPKILDFGIALLLASGGAAGRITQGGLALGSMSYMSPEQLFGEADDARADIYSLGVMLFEMATGRLPFVKDRPEALMFAIINSAAPPASSIRADIPLGLDRLIDQCMQKDPTHRPASAAAVASMLRGLLEGARSDLVAQPARNVIRAIAVLPLRNVSNDPAQDYFVGGMTEAIISDLSRIKALRVISRTSAMKYKDTSLSLPEIARELNVDAVLEGSALLIRDRVRLSVQLVSSRNEETLWSARYDRHLEDVLDLQAELAQTVVQEIAIQLTPAEAIQLATRRAVNPEAHIEFLKSRYSSLLGSREGTDLGIRHAMRALEIDPEFAMAWSALADCHVIRAVSGIEPPLEAMAAATEAANKALELDTSLADPYASLGLVQTHTGDLVGGIRNLRKAIELNPGFAMAHYVLARALSSLGRNEEAMLAVQKAVSLDPLSAMIHTGIGDAYYAAREYKKAVLSYRMSLEIDPRFDGAHTDIARSLEALGEFDEARAEYEEGRRLSGGTAGPSFGLAHLEAAAGNEQEARRILAELTAARSTRVVSAWGIGAVHASLGDVDEAFRWLEIAVKEKASGLLLLRVHPRLDPIRKDPRYWPLVEKVGLGDR